ncbi:MAG: hypothetical protein MAG453_02101 [Calditrichaeota bacterium]|nr:hypothetical protein [Calditrichota bacterium]
MYRSLRAAVLIAFAFAAGCPQLCAGSDRPAESGETHGIRRVEAVVAAALEHLHRHPAAQARDAYKFAYQACLGPAHARNEPALAVNYLTREWAALPDSGACGPVIEPLGNGLARLHLAPFKAAGGSLAGLIAAWRRAITVEPDTALFAAAWERVRARAEAEGLVSRDELAELDRLLAEHEWPAVHHSRNFLAAYDPHYRVILAGDAHALAAGTEMHRPERARR